MDTKTIDTYLRVGLISFVVALVFFAATVGIGMHSKRSVIKQNCMAINQTRLALRLVFDEAVKEKLLSSEDRVYHVAVEQLVPLVCD